MKTGLELILLERLRQVEAEGYTPDNDKHQTRDELYWAAACYHANAVGTLSNKPSKVFPATWPWNKKYWKPSTPQRDLEKAGALWLAEKARLTEYGSPSEADRCEQLVGYCAALIDQTQNPTGAELFTRTWVTSTAIPAPLDRPILAIGNVVYDDGISGSSVPFEGSIEFKEGEWCYAEKDEYGGQLSVRGDHRSKLVIHWWIDLPFDTTPGLNTFDA